MPGLLCAWWWVMLRLCLGVPGVRECSVLTDASGRRCPDCARAFGRARASVRGTAHQRGYDAVHQRARAALLAALIPGAACPRCGEPMYPDQELDAGHAVARSRDASARADRLEHARCNRSAGADDSVILIA